MLKPREPPTVALKYAHHRIDFAEAYLVASAESAGVEHVASFGRSIDLVPRINRVEP